MSAWKSRPVVPSFKLTGGPCFNLTAAGLVLLMLAVPVGGRVTTTMFPLGVASGDVTASSAVLWAKAAAARPVTVEVASGPDFAQRISRRETRASADRDNTVKLEIEGLRPGTSYHYRFVGGGAVSESGRFTTAPAAGAAADVTFAYSGDSDGTRVGDAPVLGPFVVLDRVRTENPAFFVYLGDTIYADSSRARAPAATLDEYRFKYRENRRIIFLRTLLRSTSVVAVGDDHEVQNDYDPTSVPAARLAAARQAFLEYMPVRETGRLYRVFRWGKELEVIVPDLRSFRSPQANKTGACENPPGSRAPDLAPTLPPPLRQGFSAAVRVLTLPVPPACLGVLADPSRTLLGQTQKAWIRQTLTQSDATWKVIMSSVPIQELFANPYDRWEGYAAERAEILNFIRSSGIRNVIWLSTDSHATIVNDVRVSTYAPRFDPTGMVEIITGPIAATTFARSIENIVGAAAVPVFAAFLSARPPQGVGARCVSLDRFSYATVQVSAASKTLTIIPKDATGRPICPEPVVLRATL